jgi:peptide/nickel transport system permease protein
MITLLRSRRRSHIAVRSERGVSFKAGIVVLGLIIIACILIPMVWPYGAYELSDATFQAPSAQHPFGTDSVGRDVFVRTFEGGRLDLMVAGFSVAASLCIGTLVGIVAGSTRRRWTDSILMRLTDAVIAFPFVVLILALVVVFGPTRSLGPLPAGLPATMAAFLVAGWAYYARLARAETLSLRDRDFVVAAELLGYSRRRIIFRHLVRSVIQVTGSYAVADAILFVVVIASLSFLGAGVQPPTAEWGSIMYDGRAYLDTAWWITVMPGIVLALTGLSLSLIADSLLSTGGQM